VLNQDLRPAAEQLAALTAYVAGLKAEIAALQAHVVTQGHSLSEPIDDGRNQLPITFNDIIVLRDLVNRLDDFLKGSVPAAIAPATVATALALIGVHARTFGG
ncbi:MAG TPA: hypothetical protein VFH61_05890, partial [Thermoleophilia bacterium]|nr:hypothetical protein [Thermoleophilia bacterium]